MILHLVIKNDEQYNAVLNRELRIWAQSELAHLIRGAREAKIKAASGESLSSFEVEIVKASTGKLARVLFAFNASLRFFDMKKINRAKQRPVDEIKAWIEDKGIQKFKSKFKRLHGKLPTSDTRLMNQIAWGIVKKQNPKHRRKRWYNKQKNKGLNILYSQLLDAIAASQIKQIKSQFK